MYREENSKVSMLFPIIPINNKHIHKSLLCLLTDLNVMIWMQGHQLNTKELNTQITLTDLNSEKNKNHASKIQPNHAMVADHWSLVKRHKYLLEP